MPVADYLNTNQFQDFPFYGTVDVDKSVILDCELVMGVISGFDNSQTVSLVNISFSSGNYTFRFDASGGNVVFEFVVPDTTTWGETIWVEAATSAGGSKDPNIGIGFIQIGDINAVTAEAKSSTLLPTKVINKNNHAVTSLNVANQYTTLFWDEECEGVPTPYDQSDIVVDTQDLTGEIELAPGRWVTMLSVPVDNEIQVGPARSAVAGGVYPCDPIRVLPGGYDTAAEPTCDELLYSINGIVANGDTSNFQLVGSQGVEVQVTGTSEITVTIYPLILFAPEEDPLVCP